MSEVKVTKFTLRQKWTTSHAGQVCRVGPIVVEQDGKQVFPDPVERNPQCRCSWAAKEGQ